MAAGSDQYCLIKETVLLCRAVLLRDAVWTKSRMLNIDKIDDSVASQCKILCEDLFLEILFQTPE